MVNEVRERLEQLSEEDYKNFNSRLLPGVDHVLGVRMPALRRLAAETAGRDWRAYLEEAAEQRAEEMYHEELMCQGLVLGCAAMSREERVFYLQNFIPRINSWAVCDSCVAGFRFMRKDPEFWYEYVKQFRGSEKEFELRFMTVSMLSHFIDAEHIDDILNCCGEIRHEGYYARMGNAWALSVCYVRFPEKTRSFLENDALDDFTHNRAIQKIRESYRVGREEKEYLNTLKRV